MRRARVLLLCLAYVLKIFGDVDEYLKPITDKYFNISIKHVDFIYMINLDERPEKYAASMMRLAPYGIIPYRFSAVNGWKLSFEEIDDLGVKFGSWMDAKWGTCYLREDNGIARHEILQVPGRNYFSHCMSQGAIGIVLSHLSVLQDAYDSGYQTIWVMEDDIEIRRDPHLLSDLIEELDSIVGNNGWDILFTDLDTQNNDGKRVPCTSYAWRPNFTPARPERFAEKYEISPNLRRIGSRYGAYSMIVRRSGMAKILKFFKCYQIFLPYDMEYTQPDDIRLYTVLDDVVTTQIMAISDNGAPNYKKK